jgi:DNA polymerase-3 subunit alpha
MAESLGASQVKLNLKSRTGVKLGHDCESDGRKGKKITNEEPGKLDRKGVDHYVSLHHHSTYSFLDGFALPDAHVRRAEELGMQALALTEHGNISSHVKLEQAAVKTGVKPIFGCEVYMGEVGEQRTQRKNHLTVLATDLNGYQNLMRLVSRGWEQFYYEPTVSFEDLEEFNQGLIVLSGCTGSLMSTSMVGGKNVAPEDASLRRAKAVAKKFKRVFGDRYYLETQAFPELENVCQINQGLAVLSKELEIPLVATGDVHYIRPSEQEMQQILHNVRGGNRKTLEEQARDWGYDIKLCPPTSDRYIYRRLRATGLSKPQAWAAVHATEEIANRCNVTLPKMPMVEFPVPYGYEDSLDVWRRWIEDGWRFRNVADRDDVAEYKARLRHEMKVIEDKNFIDYFLIVSDVVKFAKDNGIPVGPARGSAAASLVCYLLRITEVDPLAFPNLLFERFIDPTRKDLPDVDLDFDDTRRHEIRSYLVSKYGEECVGNIGTFTTYKSKLSLDDVARVYRIPKADVESVKELLIERSSGDLRANATIADTVDQFEVAADVFRRYPQLAAAVKLEGQVKGMGVHAAGLVVASGPLTDAAAMYSRHVAGRDVRVLSVDKYDAEHLNILKIDVLGLTTLGMISNCLGLIGKPLSWLYEIPLDDPETIRGFQANDVVGIFQFDGRAMRGVTAELKPDNFLEVCDITALARPGPLHNGAAAEYIDVKRGRKTPRQYHPLVEDIVSYTHGQIVYQEQILRITGEVGGFDHVHRATIRKIISKKLGEQEFNRWWEQFRDGAKERGVPEAEAKAIWNACITAGSYAFNVAHATSYGMLAWWTMYLKRHHPLEFYAASLRAYGNDKQLELLRDAERHGIKALPPHPARSDAQWKPGKKKLIAGLSQIKGIGDATSAKIIEYREALDRPMTWEDLTKIKGIGPKTYDSIVQFCNMEDPFEIHKLEKKVTEVKAAIRKMGPFTDIPWPSHRSIDVPYSRETRNTLVVWAGVLIKRNLKELFELHFSRTGEELDRDTVKDPDLNEWVNMWGDDGTETLNMTVSRWKYPSLREKIWSVDLDKDIVVIQGFKLGSQARRAIYVNDLWVFASE